MSSNKNLKSEAQLSEHQEDKTQRLLEQQIAVNKLALTLGESRDLATIYQTIYEHVRELTDADAFIASSYDQKTQLIHAEYVIASEILWEADRLPPIPLAPEGYGTQSQVIRTGRPLYIPDYRKAMKKSVTEHTISSEGTVEKGPPPKDREEEARTNSALYVPMRFAGQIIGVIQVQSHNFNAYTQEDTELLTSLANVAAVAIQNARLLKKTQDQAHHVQQIINAVPEGVCLIDADGKILVANQIAENFLSLLAGAKIGDTLTHLGGLPLPELLAAPSKGFWHELHVEKQIFEALAKPSTSIEGDSWVLVIRDVTQERELQKHTQQQERLAAIGQLAAGIAHDFNNIMAVIILYTQLALHDPNLSTRLQERMHTVVQQAQRASNLITQILDFSRHSTLVRQPLDFLPFLKELVKMLKRTLPENIQIELKCLPGEYMLHGDPTRIQQMLMNLVLNARDAMPEGGELHITMEKIAVASNDPPPLQEMKAGEWLCLRIQDTGTGIPQEALPHIFEPFFTTKKSGEGSGLGLAQVYGIVKQHEGEIEVKSQLNQGTTFTIYLPILHIKPTDETPLDTLVLTKGHRETILIVEDNQATQEALVASLQLLNYQTLTANNGQQALKIIDQHKNKIILILSDVVMPKMSGISLLTTLRHKGIMIPMVILTGHPLEKELEPLRAEGLKEWILKPVSLERLAQTIEKALKN